MKSIHCGLLLLAATSVGCTNTARQANESGEPPAAATTEEAATDGIATELNASLAAEAALDAAAEGVAAAAGEEATEQAAADEASAEPEQNVIRTQASPEVTKKGQFKREGIVSTPIRAYFTTQDRIVFDVQLKQAMDLFHATNGRFPNSEEEFMQQIIEFNKIILPELRPGYRYVYDPKAGELMVEHPQ